MKLFVYNWTFITKHDLYGAFQRQGIEFDIFTTNVSPRVNAQREKFREDLEKVLEDKIYDAIFSVNFFDDLAEAAHKRGILYISWTYDSPALGHVRPSLLLDTNRIFLFDSYEYNMYLKWEVPNLYYLPLAVDTLRLNKMNPTPLEKMKYYSDVSLVGQLYQSDMDKMLPMFDEYGAGYIAAMINTQLSVYGINLIEELINENIIRRICNEEVSKVLIENMNNGFFHDIENVDELALRGFLLKAVTNKERVLLLTLLAKYFRVKLFAPGNPQLPNVTACGVVDYVEHMPLVFKCSKINLNITLRNIRHGIPHRVVDILGCRALVLTNYQKDLDYYFEDGKSILIYNSIEEALDKCKYYLKNEKEAEKIRQNGYKIVKDQFSYEHQLNKIWEISGLKNKL